MHNRYNYEDQNEYLLTIYNAHIRACTGFSYGRDNPYLLLIATRISVVQFGIQISRVGTIIGMQAAWQECMCNMYPMQVGRQHGKNT